MYFTLNHLDFLFFFNALYNQLFLSEKDNSEIWLSLPLKIQRNNRKSMHAGDTRKKKPVDRDSLQIIIAFVKTLKGINYEKKNVPCFIVS